MRSKIWTKKSSNVGSLFELLAFYKYLLLFDAVTFFCLYSLRKVESRTHLSGEVRKKNKDLKFQVDL